MSYNKTLWDKAKSKLEKSYDNEQQMLGYNTYLRYLNPDMERGNVIYFRVDDETRSKTLKVRFMEDIEKALTESYFELTGDIRPYRISVVTSQEFDMLTNDAPVPFTKDNTIKLNPNYTFNSFIVGKSNKLAFAASTNVSNQPGMAYNPLFIYGDVGLGKTHLIHAIGNELLNKNAGLNIIYITSEAFFSEFIESIRTKNQESFKTKFRNADILMIDDIQFIAKGDSIQEELFHTFNSLWQNQKQIIFTSDRKPSSIPNLEDRLCSRFQQGLVAEIEKPDYETRVAILRDKVNYIAEQVGFRATVDDDVLYYIASKDGTNIRELEGALKMVFARAQLETGTESGHIGINLATAALTSYMEGAREKVITPDIIMKSVCSYFNVTVEQIKGPKRSQDIVFPRQIIQYLLYSTCNLTYIKIAELTHRNDHTSVMNSVKKISDMLTNDLSFKNTMEDIKHKLNE